MFNAFKTKFCCHKLLLLFVLLNISPLSQEVPQPQQQRPAELQETVSSSTDYLVGKRDFDLIFESFTCSTNYGDVGDADVDDDKAPSPTALLSPGQPKLLRKLSCLLNRNIRRRYLKMEMSFGRQINQFDFDISIVMQRGIPPHQQPFVIVNLTSLSGCNFLAKKHQVVLLTLARKSLDRYSNLPRQCPLLANVSYYVQNFRWDLEQMPAFFVESPVHIEFTYKFEDTTRIEGVIEAKLTLKSNKKF